MYFSLFTLLAALPFVWGAPTPAGPMDAQFKSALQTSSQGGQCGAIPALTLPAGIVVPAGQAITMATVGRGRQNYTCTGGTFVTAGAVADLYDVSCLLSKPPFFIPRGTDLPPLFSTLALQVLSYPSKIPLIKPKIDHHFIATPGSTTPSAISPGFFLLQDPATQAVLARAGSATAPNDPAKNVAWLQLGSLPGLDSLAKTVLRVHTAGGQPPSSCSTEGEKLSVEYASLYYFAS